MTIGLCFGLSCEAQLVDDPDWKETQAPPPPAFDVKRLVEVEAPAYASVKYGVDPETIAITGDGIVRYVVVASNRSGASNAFYEGVRCATGEMKTYARYSGQQWNLVADPEWKRIATMASRHTAELAGQGLCRGAAPRESVREMLKYIRQPLNPWE